MCGIAGSAAAPAARCRNLRRGSFMVPSLASCCRLRNGTYGMFGLCLLRLDVRELDHSAPFLGFFGNELAKVAGGTGQRRTALVGKPRLHLRVNKGCVNFPIERVDNLRCRILWSSYAKKRTRLVARNEIGNWWQVWEHWRPKRRCYRQGTQLTGLDVRQRGRHVVEHELYLSAEKIS